VISESNNNETGALRFTNTDDCRGCLAFFEPNLRFTVLLNIWRKEFKQLLSDSSFNDLDFDDPGCGFVPKNMKKG
jgi:hypothetical protein